MTNPRVVVHFDQHGNANYLSDGGEVDVLIIDERCPRDRVYMHGSHSQADGVIDALIGSDRVGELGDMPGTEAAIRALLNGEDPPKPRLTLTPSTTPPTAGFNI